ncbi:LacI family DNA-binding transcriptional regulator [Daejeonella sp. H1SJ63]|jgi:LacI family transcriptional regulator|uniref:LacI family DNA-binding transcriptional regulator n=1 Tax=Daejeonella sp. H1SJ63 TaxID=3034145 RepID=UPI0023EC54B1|nr:LacI family DNA-binding transcriptional regulator [Daejeonella sp. H1SJ63]
MKKQITELTGVKEIARRANVSIATVDRVLHNRKGVSEQTKEKISKIIEELNYKPNLLAQRLASRKTLRIATLIPESSNETSFWEAPLQGIEQADAEIKQLGIIVDKYFYDQNLIDSFVDQTRIILESKPDGILLAPSFIEESVVFTEKCRELKIPYVLIDSDLPNQGSLSYIGPNLYHSGYLGAHLVSYLTGPEDKTLIVNISREIDNHHHLLKKEEGFRAYFKDHHKPDNIIKIDIRETDLKSIEHQLSKVFEENNDIKVVFVTNSRVSTVAHFIESLGKDLILIGYDFLKENIGYMDKGVIDFLVCQKPKQQAYRGLMSLYQHLAFSSPVEKIYFMPIDILTKENSSFYRN